MYIWGDERGVCDDGNGVVKVVVEAHEPHGVKRIYDGDAPAIPAGVIFGLDRLGSTIT